MGFARYAGILVVVLLVVASLIEASFIALPISKVPATASQLAGCANTVYSTNVTIGNSQMVVLVDTGSSTLAAGSTLCGSDCSAMSQTYNPVPTGVALGVNVTLNYGDGSALTGPVYADVVRI